MSSGRKGEGSRVILKVDRRFCSHCQEYLSFKTYNRHKRLYYNTVNDRWTFKHYPNDSSEATNISDESPPRSFGNAVPDSEDNDTCNPPGTSYEPLQCRGLESLPLNDTVPESRPGDIEYWDETSDCEQDLELVPPRNEYRHDISDEEKKAFSLGKWICEFVYHFRNKYSLSDNGTALLLKFFGILFGTLGKIYKPLHIITQCLPKSLYSFRSTYYWRKIYKFVVCSKCYTVYSYDDCKENNGSKLCLFVRFPNHPHSQKRLACGAPLLKTVELVSQKRILYLYLAYCYISLQESLQKLLLEPSFLEKCEQWRSRTVSTDCLSDIYDGNVWKEFQNWNGEPFLSEPCCFGLTINLDWFRPFKHSEYSIGAIYMTMMNLPRNERNKQSNVILVGIIPGPSEPTNLNGFLAPLVKELNELWKGLLLSVAGCTAKKTVRCALLCATCDLPAGRKLCGFLSYNAHQGCSRCIKSFSSGYGGFEREKWKSRSRASHLETVSKIDQCSTKKAVTEIECKTGYRYTELLKLPYFVPSQMLVVDPMHNLFLGSGKHILKDVWIDRNIIVESKFLLIQSRIDKIVVPSDIGRIPHKIRSGFSAFTADQYKNWIIYYSLLSLHDILLGNDLECWRHFVLACRLLCQHQITKDQLKLADVLLMQFCKRCERMYGGGVITPNMHMHSHLCECMRDFGPAHVFWLFSFERYNGILEHIPSNNRSIEIQITRRFVESSCGPDLPEEYREEFAPIFKETKVVGSLIQQISNPLGSTPDYLFNVETHKLPKYFQRTTINSVDLSDLKELYSKILGKPIVNINAPHSICQYQQIYINGKLFGSLRGRSVSSSIVMAMDSENEVRAARVLSYALHTIVVSSQTYTFLLFQPAWFKCHQQHHFYGKPVTVWELDCYESNTINFLPVQHIISRTASLVDKCSFSNSSHENVLLVCPIVE